MYYEDKILSLFEFSFFRQMHLILAMPFDVLDRPFGRSTNTKYNIYLQTIFAKPFVQS